jgi:NAD(P)H-flavin reductase
MTATLPDPMVPRPYRVQHVRRETADTFTLELVPEGGSDIPPFATGQFNMLYVFGTGEIPISISGDPAKRRPLVHTTRAVGTVSRAMRELKPDDVIGVRGPFGSHWPIEQAEGKGCCNCRRRNRAGSSSLSNVSSYLSTREVRQSCSPLRCANSNEYSLSS